MADTFPFEIHITVDAASSLNNFTRDCHAMGVKPIVLDLYVDDQPIGDVMTSSTMRGSLDDALAEARSQSEGLTALGYRVLREKIETVPWHPAAKVHSPEGYFETHFAFATVGDDLRAYCAMKGIHLSRNKMKIGAKASLMGTYRRHCTRGEFDQDYQDILREITARGFNLTKEPEIEYSIYDTKETHDSMWINQRKQV